MGARTVNEGQWPSSCLYQKAVINTERIQASTRIPQRLVLVYTSLSQDTSGVMLALE